MEQKTKSYREKRIEAEAQLARYRELLPSWTAKPDIILGMKIKKAQGDIAYFRKMEQLENQS